MKLPDWYHNVRENYPELVEAYDRLGDAAYRSGTLSKREQRLVKLAYALATALEGAAHSHARRGLYEGIAPEELRHVALLAVTTLGFPSAVRALSWIEEVIGESAKTARPS